VRDQLLTADLVVQVLGARKLMTWGDRETLRDWLLDRGIKTVVFAVNFMNLLEIEEQKEVSNRMRFVAESFRSQLPNNISNLYRVDALPALRARLKGDMSALQVTGLGMFESALQSIVAVEKEKTASRLPRVLAIATQVRDALRAKVEALATGLRAAEDKRNAKIQIQQRAEKLIKQGFEGSVSDFQGWLYLPKLLECFQSELAAALQQGQFSTWESGRFRQEIIAQQQAIVSWVNKACEFFNREGPGELMISFPGAPEVLLPPPPKTSKSSSSGAAPVAIATGLGWVLGGPVGAAVAAGATYLLNQTGEAETPAPSASYLSQVQEAYAKAAENYLTRFSTDAFSALREYEEKAGKVISFQVSEEPVEIISQRHQLQLVRNLVDNLTQELESVRASLAE
jgi:plasmid stabilization system protein ParE